MDIIALTDTGCEEACKQEAEQLLGIDAELHENAIFFKTTLDTACKYAYLSKVARRVLIAIDEESLTACMRETDTFKVTGEILFDVDEITQELIEQVANELSFPNDVSLDKPDVVVHVCKTKNETHIGFDITGNMSKREWRIMLSRRSLKSTIAAATIIYAQVEPDQTILNPLADDGTLGIEAALILSGKSPMHFAKRLPWENLPGMEGTDWNAWRDNVENVTEIADLSLFCATLKELKSIRMNAKLAGVEKQIHATRVPVDWADLKVEESSCDRIIACPPQSGRSLPEKKAEELIDNFFNQAAHFLKDDGMITCITQKPESLSSASDYGLEIVDSRTVFMGKQEMTIVGFKHGM